MNYSNYFLPKEYKTIKKLKIEQELCKEGDLFNPNFHDAKYVM